MSLDTSRDTNWNHLKKKHKYREIRDISAEPEAPKKRKSCFNKIDDPAFIKRLAQLWAEGMTWKGMAVNMECSPASCARCMILHREYFPPRNFRNMTKAKFRNVTMKFPVELIERAGRRNHKLHMKFATYVREVVKADLARKGVI